jgi:predicted transcriptional regulator
MKCPDCKFVAKNATGLEIHRKAVHTTETPENQEDQNDDLNKILSDMQKAAATIERVIASLELTAIDIMKEKEIPEKVRTRYAYRLLAITEQLKG